LEPVPVPPLSCKSQAWRAHNARVRCGEIGGKVDVIEVADNGTWTHAYQEVAVVPDVKYEVSVEFYAEQFRFCDDYSNRNSIVRWCSPSLVICPGPYHNRVWKEDGPNGTCYVGLAPYRNGAWEALSAIFEPSVEVVTIYIAQVERARAHPLRTTCCTTVHNAETHSTQCCDSQHDVVQHSGRSLQWAAP
jgi:hypothetical protein